MNTKRVKTKEKCPECNKDIYCFVNPIDSQSYYCKPCNANHFRNNFQFWDSGDSNVNNLIRESQLNADRMGELIEWIDYSNFEKVKSIGEGGFASVSKAIWKDGPLLRIGFAWSLEESKWKREGKTKVALKRLRNSTNLTLDVLNEIRCNLNFNGHGINRLYGITRDPQTKEYIIISEFKPGGNLRNLIRTHYSNITWRMVIYMLSNIGDGLHKVHENNYCHKDLHSGNILNQIYSEKSFDSTISDFGLCRPANENSVDQSLYGVLPFVAPEVLRGGKFTKAADIYGFGMIMFEILSGEPPFIDREHDIHLALALCEGERPPIPKYAPEPYIKLMEQCWSPDPNNRPTAYDLSEELIKWLNELEHDHVLLQLFTKEREEMWRARLRELVENPRPLKASQNLLTSKRFDYVRQLGMNVVNKIGTSND
ncbi:11727_t:CDS:2, partial [Acaulospora morrowiae]